MSDFDPKHVWVVPRRSAAFVDHNYHDYSTCSLPEDLDNVLDYSSDSSEAVEKNFSLKLHGILEKEEYKNYVTWMAHGRGFRILVPRIFEEVICPIYFNHSRYSTFMRQLNNYGFKVSNIIITLHQNVYEENLYIVSETNFDILKFRISLFTYIFLCLHHQLLTKGRDRNVHYHEVSLISHIFSVVRSYIYFTLLTIPSSNSIQVVFAWTTTCGEVHATSK